MAKLIYSMIASLDGYIADEDGKFDWAVPDQQVHAFLNDLERPIGTYLYGRRMYETMVAWETVGSESGHDAVMLDFAKIWRAADKIVYSRTLDAVSSARTAIERDFDPDVVRRLKAESERDITVGGPGLAAEALRDGLIDECRVLVTPVVVGGGTKAYPDRVRVDLELLDERRFDSGMVYLSYRART